MRSSLQISSIVRHITPSSIFNSDSGLETSAARPCFKDCGRTFEAPGALVFLLVGLQNHWRQPVAYFLTDKACTSNQAAFNESKFCRSESMVCHFIWGNHKYWYLISTYLDVGLVKPMIAHLPTSSIRLQVKMLLLK